MNLEKHFAAIGAQLDVRNVARLGGRDPRTYDVDVQGRGRNEHFVLRLTPTAPEFHVLQAKKIERHLLLMARTGPREAERFLCGHDERHWFAASVVSAVSTIAEARRALLPRQFDRHEFTPEELRERRGPRFKRQGEWFFVPVDVTKMVSIYRAIIHRNEPLVRPGGGKAHIVSELVRFGGTAVVIADTREYSVDDWERLDDEKKRIRHRFMIKDPEVYVRGPIRHPDHATLILPDWHRVFVNGEVRSGSLSFYD